MFPETEELYDEEYYEGDFIGASDADEDDDFPWEELEEGEGVNLEDFRLRAWQRLYQHFACSLGGRANPTDALLTEAELHMLHVDYTQALICALATESIDGRANLRRQMICTIALYQLGDKKKAIELKDAILTDDDQDFQNISVYLGERFKGTCEVLSMMPDLLHLLRSMPPSASSQ
jgi:hypothetical protein